MARNRPDNVQSFLVSDRLETQNRLDLLSDAFSSMERTLDHLMEHLCRNGQIDPAAAFISQWKESLTALRRRGLRRSELPGEEPEPTVTCPGCKAVLRNVDKPGDRCDWCGYVFPLECPSCERQLEKVTGMPGDICLWCHHQF